MEANSSENGRPKGRNSERESRDYDSGYSSGSLRDVFTELNHNDTLTINQVQNDDASCYIPPGKVEEEQYRLATYKFLNHTERNLNINELAKWGFYYIGKETGIQCFSCMKETLNWQVNYNPRDRQFHKNDCKMLLGNDKTNVPVNRLFRSIENDSTNMRNLSYSGNTPAKLTNAPNNPVTNPASTREVVTLTNFRTSNHMHKSFLRQLNLAQEEHRRQTFDNWPSTAPQNLPSVLARVGFFYLGEMDRVQCYACGGIMRNWSANDNVEEEHRANFPSCRRNNAIPRIQTNHSQRLNITGVTNSEISPGLMPNNSQKELLRQIYTCSAGVNPHMADEHRRLETFDSRWEGQNLLATKEQIAKAGFFFLGESDRTKCWYCSGGLQNWETEDDPWTEHAKWFPGCEFVLRELGPLVVKSMVEKHPNLSRPPISNQVDYSDGLRILNDASGVNKGNLLQVFLQSNIVQKAKEMGFSYDRIKKAAQRKWQDGSIFTSLPPFVEALMESENDSGENMETEEISPSSTELPCRTEHSHYSLMPSGVPLLKVNNTENVNVTLNNDNSTDGDVIEQYEIVRNDRLCKKCKNKNADILCLPCGHLSICGDCSKSAINCAICKKRIQEKIHVFLA